MQQKFSKSLGTKTSVVTTTFTSQRTLCYLYVWLSSFEKLRTLLTDWMVLTCSHLSGDAFLKISKARVELLTDRSHLEVAENLIRGGVSLVFSKRLATINNKYLEGFDETKAGRYGFLVDANNLYGGILQKFPLPLNEFEIVDVELSTILSTILYLQIYTSFPRR